MGRFLSESSTKGIKTATLTAGNNIITGNVVTVGINGNAFGQSTNNSLAYMKTADALPVLNSAITTEKTGTASFYSTHTEYLKDTTVISFDDGTIVSGYTGNGASSGVVNLNYKIGMYGSRNTIVTTNTVAFSINKLDENKFLVYYNQTTTEKRFRIVAKDGTVLKADTIVTSAMTINDGGSSYAISNGVDTIALFYVKLTGTYFQLYDYAGTAVGLEVLIDAYNYPSISAKFLNNGNFFVLYSATNIATTKQFSKLGVIVGTAYTLNTQTSNLMTYARHLIFEECIDGIIISARTINLCPVLTKVSFTNTFVKTISHPIMPITSTAACHVKKLNNGDYLWLVQYSTASYVCIVNDNLELTAINTTSIPIMNMAGNTYHRYEVIETSAGIVICGASFNNTNYYIDVLVVSDDLSYNNKKLAVIAAGTTNILGTKFIYSNGYIYTYHTNSLNTTGFPQFRKIIAEQQSILGVATTTATTGADVTVQLNGESTLSGKYNLVGAFDLRTNLPLGNRGYIVGNKAYLDGIKI